jgi:hypothetical protein
MWFRLVKQPFHTFDRTFRHTVNAGMLKPVLGSIFSKRKFRQAVSRDVFVQVK